MFWIDTTKEAPECLNLKSDKNLATNKQDSCTFSNATYSCEIKSEPLSPNNNELVKLPNDKSYFGRREQQMKNLQIATEETSKNGNATLTPKVYSRHCTLYPPQNGIIPKSKQPPGCKTVVIAGLPHSFKTGMVRQMFKDRGNIQQIFSLEKGVFQITYSCQTAVNNVMKFNAYKVVGTHKNIPFAGTIEVEFAPIWLEKHGFTGQKISYPNFSKKAVVLLIQHLKQNSMVQQSVNVLISWLEEGKCTKNNYLHFYLVLQAMHSVVSRCISDQNKFEQLVCQNYCSQILKVFTLACCETVLDNLNQYKNQVVKWKKYIEEINGCKSWDAISAFKKTKLDPENFVQQESKTLSKILYSKSKNKVIKKLIQGLEQDRINKKGLKLIVLGMEAGKCNRKNYSQYFFALKAMYGFISRFISEPTKFEELVRRRYCGSILQAFNVACSRTVFEKIKQSKTRNKIEMWKKYIEKVNECKSWDAISAFAKREMKQIMVKSEIIPTEREQLNIELKAAKTKNFNQNNETGNCENDILSNETENHSNETGNYENDILSNETENHSNEREIQIINNINNETVNYTNENDIQIINIETVNYTNEKDLQTYETCNHTNENDFQNNETVSHKNETGNLNKENDVQNTGTGNHNIENGIPNKESNNQNDDNQNDIGVKIVGKEARLIAALGAFLNLHSIGASIEAICRYLLQIDPAITCQGIEGLMRKFPTVFKEELTSDGSLKTKWTILGL